jgi:hypothetical protein
MNCPNLRFRLLPTFAKTLPLFLLACAFSLCPLHAESVTLFDAGYKWQVIPDKATKAEASISQETVDNSGALIVHYDFSQVEKKSSIRFFADKNVEIQAGNGPIRFRVKASAPFGFNFQIKDSNRIVHSLTKNYDQVEGWSEIEIPLDYAAFSGHGGTGIDPELAKTITFPIDYLGFSFSYTANSTKLAPTGAITFADPSKSQ